jgi:hypothetical protein
MKTASRFGALLTLFGLLLVLFSSGGGFGSPPAVHAAPGNNLTIRVNDTDTTVDHSFAVTRPAPCTPVNAVLSNGEFATYNCPAPGEWTITVTPAAGRIVSGSPTCTLSDTDATTVDAQSSQTSFNGNVLTLQILDNEDYDCTFPFGPSVTSRTLTVDAAPAVIPCGGTSDITAVVRDQNGNVVNGLTFKFTTDSGTLSDNAGAGTVTLTLVPGSKDATVTASVVGEADIEPATVAIDNQCAPLSIFADPPYLPCGGGTTKLTAVLRDEAGNVVPNAVFQWSTDGGALDVGKPNSPEAIDGKAVLFLPSPITSATITVVAAGESETVSVNQVCGDVAIAITADPNVIPCGGTANLTARGRDANGHNVDLLGYHWETDIGLLYVGPPNTADETDGRATLTLIPGMGASDNGDGTFYATVRVWVGDFSDFPATVRVQQYCPGVEPGKDGTEAAGQIQLTASTQTAGCGEAVFIGARIKDSKNVPVRDGTPVRFLASAGVFQADETGVNTSYTADASTQTLNTVSQREVGTLNGVLNLTYLAPLYGGDAVITAASGDKFGKLTIHINCGAPPPAAVAGATGSGPACTPIGDGVCIRAPGSGVSIRPPSTGDAGLK